MYVCILHFCLIPTEAKESIRYPGTGVIAVSCNVDAKNWTKVLWMSSWSSLLLTEPGLLLHFYFSCVLTIGLVWGFVLLICLISVCLFWGMVFCIPHIHRVAQNSSSLWQSKLPTLQVLHTDCRHKTRCWVQLFSTLIEPVLS